ncbi:MAG: hypothetical protein LUC26_05080 [Prevotella sp.]|nr:hypothetical protein [Prevotella sp.]
MKKRYIKPFADTTKVAFVHVIAASDPNQASSGVGTGWNAKGNGDWDEEDDDSGFGW